ncbi:helix-turn-helix domain-containing protein [Vibrio cyclitrophicus]|uniref:helix-turn-helix domain-containing protein n=1 Tax=Vibrio cyclitrophicus TaxID=47951 RepID=UPI000299EBCE|nr:helix-turn-helix transcriptional regulator [Vibrio cyclitrophicus]OEE24315.1 transcriptional regulator [Vibrio cyclitrophicus ZF14]
MNSITKPKNITGERIKKTRLDKGLSQQDVERIATLRGMDLTRSKLAKIETGMIRVTDKILHNLAVVLNVNVNVFFNDSEE